MSDKRNHIFFHLILLSALSFSASPGMANWVWSPESGKFVSTDNNAQTQDYADEMFQQARQFMEQKDHGRAIEEFRNLIRKYPSAWNASEAQYYIGLSYEQQADYRNAAEAYQKLVDHYPQSQHVQEVIERLYQIGNLYLEGGKDKFIGIPLLSRLPVAIQIFEHIVKVAPYGKYGDQAQFQLGTAYRKTGQYQSALDAFQKLIDQYATSSLAEEARYQLAETSYEFSKNATRDERAIDDAINNISDFLEQHPESSVTDKVKLLRQEIAERDAEKGYGIASYYESQNQLESAALYYEDVVNRYPDTSAGRLAREKLKELQTPLEAYHMEREQLQNELGSVESQIQSAAMQKQQRASNKETAKQQADELKQEMQQLEKKRDWLEQTQTERLAKRKEAFKRDEKEWEQSWEVLEKKKKKMKDNSSPELARAFSSWEQSLIEEKERLALELQRIEALAQGIGAGQGWLHFKLPFMGVSTPDADVVSGKDQGKLAQIDNELKTLRREREQKEAILGQVNLSLGEFGQDSYGSPQTQASLQALIDSEGGVLKEKQQKIEKQEDELKALVLEFEKKRKAYADKFGEEKTKRWLVASEQDHDETAMQEQMLMDLQFQKARLGEQLIRQHEIIDTISNTFYGKAKDFEVKVEEVGNEAMDVGGNSASDIAARRQLKKRVKLVEREIRQRLDEIEDWHSQKEEAIAHLKEVMKSNSFSGGKWLKPITAPLNSFLSISRSFAFGLGNEDARIIKKAERIKKSRWVSAEKKQDISKLQEEIQLESLLIQGRYEEVQTLKNELEELYDYAAAANIKLRPMFFERSFEIGKESLRSAGRLLSTDDQNALLIEKLNEETQKLQTIEADLAQTEKAIAQIANVKESISDSEQSQTAEQPSETENAAAEQMEAGVSEAKSGEIKQPAENNQENDQEDQALRVELDLLLDKLQMERKTLLQEKQAFETEKAEFYRKQTAHQAASQEAQTTEDKKTRRQHLKTKRQLEKEISQMKSKEKDVLSSKSRFLESKKKEIKKEIEKASGQTMEAGHQALLASLQNVENNLSETYKELDALSVK
ncbi:MAG: hypothetical protein COV74_10145 [Candidatus Omnitrophica bacterium CG11_big_fil_rev_8_21_14_0_20_45_26]|uniref:Outer membrane lipoprotein BamD-like domain-containing protein n=1 Tax=Candidatus Abzuiibacterium crystallinum TaxID=1974748 RepID=A0A2H0LL60_9BACT|nr:MAG: hypothetical protein COV74_10145 [Candidatus Omnitrophica bacterium CG11_big_fil_rev_8_21_14_0_20_45_26]PIW63799.1 MAG: hypothetical protein COW12_09030 [Candidatus Omnitrophica bacterium CG12_big_fil_rev_8_21_14_0_65_45_16]